MTMPIQSQLTALVLYLCRNRVPGQRLFSSTKHSSTVNLLSRHNCHSKIHLYQRQANQVIGNGKTRASYVLSDRGRLFGDRVHCPQNFSMSSSYHTLLSTTQYNNISNSEDRSWSCLHHVRYKGRKRRSTDIEEDSDSDSNVDDKLDEDDFDAPAAFKVMNIHVSSLRIDGVLSSSLGLSRNHLEDVFYGPGLLMNGRKVLKKASKMDEGDYVDVVMEKSEDQLKVKRVKVLKVGSEKTRNDKFIVKVRVWRAPFFIEKPDSSSFS